MKIIELYEWAKRHNLEQAEIFVENGSGCCPNAASYIDIDSFSSCKMREASCLAVVLCFMDYGEETDTLYNQFEKERKEIQKELMSRP